MINNDLTERLSHLAHEIMKYGTVCNTSIVHLYDYRHDYKYCTQPINLHLHSFILDLQYINWLVNLSHRMTSDSWCCDFPVDLNMMEATFDVRGLGFHLYH